MIHSFILLFISLFLTVSCAFLEERELSRKNSSAASDESLQITFDDDEKTVMVLDDATLSNGFPRNFRVPLLNSHIQKKKKLPNKERFSVVGFNDLYISGSGQFTTTSFDNIDKEISRISRFRKKKFIHYYLDLRQETHFFVNGLPVTLFGLHNAHNKGKNTEEILEIEKELTTQLKNQKEITLFDAEDTFNKGETLVGKMTKIPVKSIMTEKELVESKGFIYKRFPMTDHYPPTPQEEREFLTFFYNLPPNAWLHVHCRAGKGRTTTLMMMVDILKNKNRVQLDHFIRRHAAIGGSDFFKIQSIQQRYIFNMFMRRLQFLGEFYRKT